MMNRIPTLIMVSLAVVVVSMTIVELFPRSGHLGAEPDRLMGTIVAAVIATVVMLVFRAARGSIHIKFPILGAKTPLEFTATQTQASLWCLVYIVVKVLS